MLKKTELTYSNEEQLEASYVINVVLRNIKILKEDIQLAVAGLDEFICQD